MDQIEGKNPNTELNQIEVKLFIQICQWLQDLNNGWIWILEKCDHNSEREAKWTI